MEALSGAADGGDRKVRFCIDRGGTFTDVYAEWWEEHTPWCVHPVQLKLLSVDPQHYVDAPAEGIRRVLEAHVLRRPLPKSQPIPSACVTAIRMGTTVATNNLLERKGERVCLLITRGFRDILQIANQARPHIFDLQVRKPGVLYEHVIECNERVALAEFVLPMHADMQKTQGSSAAQDDHEYAPPGQVVTGISGEDVVVLEKLDEDDLRAKLQHVYDTTGIRSVAIAFAHSYTYPEHECAAARIATEIGFTHVSTSAMLMPMVKLVSRGITSVVDAYLTPGIQAYIRGFFACFDSGIKKIPVYFMQSDGSLAPASEFYGFRAVLSGPAGGVVGFARTCYGRNRGQDQSEPLLSQQPVIGFDMGGTSTDVSRYDGEYDIIFENNNLAGVTVQAPQLDINTVAAGGGSRLLIENETFVVGPESVGAHPGPACYKKGGALAVTDANLVLGRLDADFFPRIFGPNEDEPLGVDASRVAFEKLYVDLEGTSLHTNLCGTAHPLEELALGFLNVANEAMCRPIRELSESRGHDPAKHVLAVFGGAGGQHACAIARILGMRAAFVHRYAGILSAYGMGLADVVSEQQEPIAIELSADAMPALCERYKVFESRARAYFREALGFDEQAENGSVDDVGGAQMRQQQHELHEGHRQRRIQMNHFLNLRYEGTDTAFMVRVHGIDDGDMDVANTNHAATTNKNRMQSRAEKMVEEFETRFRAQYRREFGFELTGRRILGDDARVQAVLKSPTAQSPKIAALGPDENPESAPVFKTRNVYWEVHPVGIASSDGNQHQRGMWMETRCYLWSMLKAGHVIAGPAVIVMDGATVVIEPRCEAIVDEEGNIDLLIAKAPSVRVDAGTAAKTEADAVQLSIFNNRFMSIAEQMGRALQRTSISTNIKERLDFSCAIFDPTGGLVANAPHVPVHLGAMSETIKWQLSYWNDPDREALQPGDVLCSNHPNAGGSHLPDITVITPVFEHQETAPDGSNGFNQIVFFVASRAHHADVGGSTPGSMPPFSTSLDEEGAAILSMKLVRGGVFQEDAVRDLLLAAHTRKVADNLSDLKAQIAANQKGIALIRELIRAYTLPIVHAYMRFVQDNAALAVRNMLGALVASRSATALSAVSSAEKHDETSPEAGEPTGHLVLQADDFMDDGTRIALKVTISREQEGYGAEFDFSGTGSQVRGNWNAPRAITMAAVIYSLRCLVDKDIPLNQGCMMPVRVHIPAGSVLDPAPGAAVVGGNVMTSQRVTDVILKAFGAVAASQGCMNNFTFGDASFGMYETIGGGCGAGPSWHGTSGVQTHMTNTRITDVEVLERRYPVLVREFSLRHNSGGRGTFNGGDGLCRKIEFLRPMVASICSERRGQYVPFGMAGGEPGQRGVNTWVHRQTGQEENIGGKASCHVIPGDVFCILTPGGGAWGRAEGF
ncbi:5-oxoprolinase [Porphyridium purpureum]|uniref:5-oxoprolinase n=1 Tax=Porphyridium purpureum TaxID=35688 RepID=A0A5J4YRX4_PORPP|nr:5-oxoprolinase [Porphyridium purpureum]|eukprot:POR0087..scf296_7